MDDKNIDIGDTDTLETIEEKQESGLRRLHEFLKEAGRVAWRTQKTPIGKLWAILFLSGNFSLFELMMGTARFMGGDSYFPFLAVIPVFYLFLSVKADLFVIGHFAESYEWKDRVRFQSFVTDKIPHIGTRKIFSRTLIGISLFLCGALTYLARLGIFIFFSQKDISLHWGKRLFYIGTCVRVVLTYFGVHVLAAWIQGIL